MYNGYNVKVNNIVIPNSCMVVGSYVHTPRKRIRSERKDANGINHYKYFPTLQHYISFKIKAGTKAEYDTLRTALGTRNNAPVTFYDEDSDSYISGTFEMTAPDWGHSYSDNLKFYYAETPIELIEH